MKIVILEPLAVDQATLDETTQPLIAAGHEIVTHDSVPQSDDDIISRLADADIAVVATLPLNETVIAGAPHLSFIAVAFTGVDHIAIDACRERNIAVANAAGYGTQAVAELTIGLSLSLLRSILPLDSATRDGKTRAGYAQHELSGKTVGIVGTGAIGQRVAELALAFDCNVVAYNRSKHQSLINRGVRYVELPELLNVSDIVSLHVPLTDETRGLIGKNQFNRMKKSAIIINTARGPIIDNVALAEALKNNDIAGAGIDVFDGEPPLNQTDPLLQAPNAIVTPHIGFATTEALQRRAVITMKNIENWLNDTPQNLV